MNKLLIRFFIAILLIGSNVHAFAADKVIVDFEYLPSSVYESAIGFGAYKVKEEDAGLYVNFQTTYAKREPKYDTLGIASFGDPVVSRFIDISIFNIGVTRKISETLSLYAGGGYASATGQAQKFDASHILASDGNYYVNDPANDRSGGNINIGLLFNIDKIAFNMGYHSFTKTAYYGLGAKF